MSLRQTEERTFVRAADVSDKSLAYWGGTDVPAQARSPDLAARVRAVGMRGVSHAAEASAPAASAASKRGKRNRCEDGA
jgi:hypothetical protein